MIEYSKNLKDQPDNTDPTVIIATILANHLAKKLLKSQKIKNYPTYINCLAEVLKWSHEFCNLYYYIENTRESADYIRNTITHNDATRDILIAWGENRIQLYLAQKKAESDYSLKYSINNSNDKQILLTEQLRMPIGKQEYPMGKG